MKKGFIVLTALMVLLLTLPISSAFAFTGGLLNGKLPTTSFEVTGTLSKITDDNTVNSTDPIFNFTTGGMYSYVEYDLGSPATIDKLLLMASSRMVYTIHFYDNNHTLISNVAYSTLSTMGSNDPEVKDITNVENVRYVKLSLNGNASTTTNYYVTEFDVFGAKTIIHDEISDLVTVDMNPGVSMSWTVPSSNVDFTGSKIYRNGTFLTTISGSTNVYNDTTAIDGETYTYKVTATYSDGFETSGVSSTITPVTPPDTVAPLEPTAIQYSPTKDSILVTWTDPADPDLKQINIYKDDVLVGNAIKGTGSYTITNLTSETAYSIKLTAVDLSGNESVGVVQSVTTNSDVDLTAPTAPTGIEVTNYSNGALVQWNKNLEPDLQGYNIYIDGVKDNATPITQTSYQIFGLEVGQTYSITVSAVDTSNNESLPSLAVSAVPSADNMPILKMGYELKDVADGVAGWFSNMWLIVAFAVAIPLAFYIAMRTKLLFVG